jgi:succinate-semialdehyde dehydrogenase/glutarate-semialdehyde dehydrogenase
VITENANIDNIIESAVNGRMRNGGQACNSSKRFLIPAKYYDEFVEKYSKAMSELVIGDPMDPSTQVQPLSSEKSVIEIGEQVERAIKSGARLMTGGKRIERK